MTSTTAPPAIALRAVTKSFGEVHAVRGVDLQVGQGEVVAYLGPNGAGKTTTIDMILGLTQPSSGSVSVFGMAPREAIDRGLVSAVLQTGGLLPDLTVRETIRYTAALFPAPLAVEAVLERAGIAELADRKVGKCSGGEQQRVRFAMALVSDPELIILDEPTAGMDVAGRRTFWENIRADAGRGRTVVFATHYLDEADAYADRVVLLRKGEIVADGTAAEVRALGTGRTVRATWPGVDESTLAGIPHAQSVEVRGEQILVHTGDSDAVARHLLNHTPARDLEILARGLEDAFVALTGDQAAEPDRVASTPSPTATTASTPGSLR